MSDPSPKGLELTADRIAYAKRVAIATAKKCCGPRIVYDDAVGQAMLHLMRALPTYDPSRKASPQTWIFTVVSLAVIKYAKREQAKLDRLQSMDGPSGEPMRPTQQQETALRRLHGRWPADHDAGTARIEEALELIDNEDSKRMCRLLIEHNGNRSQVARHMGITEGAVRGRIKTLRPKFLAMGFDLFGEGDMP